MTFAALLVTQKREKRKVSLRLSSRETNGLPYNITPEYINKKTKHINHTPDNTYIEKHLVFAEKFPQKILLPARNAFRRGTEVLI